MDSENWAEAEDLFLKAIEKDPQPSSAYAYLGRVYQKMAGYYANEEDEKTKHVELSLRAFDEAIRRQTTDESRARYWWLKGISFGLVGQTAYKERAFQDADKLQPGFTEQANAKSAWMDRRTCETCGKIFTLSDHGHPGAWAAAETLQEGKGSDETRPGDYFALSECPVCKKKTVLAILEESMDKQAKDRNRGLEER